MDLNGKNICIFGASSPATPKRLCDEAFRVGKLAAKHGAAIVCGAGRAGIMRAVSDGALEARGTVVGVIPQFMVDKGWAYPALSETIVTPDMHSRKLKMAQLAHAIVAMPGGVGTLEELLEAITWRQLSISCHPIVLLNVDNYFEPLIGMLDTAIDNHLMAPDNRRLWHVASSADEAIDFLVSYNKNESRIIADKY